MKQCETSGAQFVGRRLNGIRILDLEFQAYLRHRSVGGPLRGAEAGLRRLRKGPDAEVLTATDPLTVEVVAALARL